MKYFQFIYLCRRRRVLAGCNCERADFGLCRRRSHAGASGGEPAATVPVNIRSTGTLHARQTAMISAQVVGRIQQILVREAKRCEPARRWSVLETRRCGLGGSGASRGEGGCRIEQAAAQTDADLAASTLARYRQLQAQKSVSPQEMDEVSRRAEASSAQVEALRAQADAAKAQEAGAHAMLGYTRFSGAICRSRNGAHGGSRGRLASPGVPLLQIDQRRPAAIADDGG